MYRFESNLVDEFLSVSRSSATWDQMKTCTEFDYQRGRTDIIAIDQYGVLIAQFVEKISIETGKADLRQPLA